MKNMNENIERIPPINVFDFDLLFNVKFILEPYISNVFIIL